jgi:hypothetical protein
MALDDTVFGAAPGAADDEVYPQPPANDPMGVMRDLARHALSDIPQESPVDSRAVMNRLMRKAVQEHDWDKPFPKPVMPVPRQSPESPQTPTQRPPGGGDTDFSEYAAPGSVTSPTQPKSGSTDDFSEYAEKPEQPGAQPGQTAETPPPAEGGEQRPWWRVFSAMVADGLKETAHGSADVAARASMLAGWASGQEYFEGLSKRITTGPSAKERVQQETGRPGGVWGTSVGAGAPPGEEFKPTDAERASIAGQVGSGVGGLVGLTPALATGGFLGGATLMGLLGAEHTAQEAEKAGASTANVAGAAAASGVANFVLGAIPLHVLLKPVERMPGVANWVAAKAQQATQNGVVFATIGEAQHWVAQQIANEFYATPDNQKTETIAERTSRLVAGFLTGAIIGPFGPTKKLREEFSGSETVPPDEFLRRAGAAPPPGGGPGTARGASWRDEIDEFLRARAAREAGGAPPKPGEAPKPGAKSRFDGLTEDDVTDILKAKGFSDDEIAKMHPDYVKGEIEEAIAGGYTPKPRPGTRVAPLAIEDLNSGGIARPPTPGQQEAGNYQHTHAEIPELGLTGRNGISIENDRGSIRQGPRTPLDERGTALAQSTLQTLEQVKRAEINARQPTDNTDKQIAQLQDELKHGKPSWRSPPMPTAYGRAKRILGADSTKAKPQGLDFFIGPGGRTFVIDQIDPKTGKFDEHKVMHGFTDVNHAAQAYLDSYSDNARTRFGAISPITPEQFTQWTANGRVPKRPFSNDLHARLKGASTPTPGGVEGAGPREPTGRPPSLGGGEGETGGPPQQPETKPTVPSQESEGAQGIDDLTKAINEITGAQPKGTTGGPRAPVSVAEAPAEQPAQQPAVQQPAAGHPHEQILAAFKQHLAPHEFEAIKDFDGLINTASHLMETHGWDAEQAVGVAMAEYYLDLGLTTPEEIGAKNGENTREAVEQAHADVPAELPSEHGVQTETPGAGPVGTSTETVGPGRDRGGEVVGGEGEGVKGTEVGEQQGTEHASDSETGGEHLPAGSEERVPTANEPTANADISGEREGGQGSKSHDLSEPVDHDKELKQALAEINLPIETVPEDLLDLTREIMEREGKEALEAFNDARDEIERREGRGEDEGEAISEYAEETARPRAETEKGGTGVTEREATEPTGEHGPRTGPRGGPRTPGRERGGERGGTETGGPREPGTTTEHGGPHGEPVSDLAHGFRVGDLVKVKSGVIYKIESVRDQAKYGDKEPSVSGVSQRNGKNYGPSRLLLVRNLIKYGVETKPGETGGPKTPTTVPVTEAERAKYNKEITIDNGKKTERVQVQMDPVWSEGDQRFAVVGYRWVKTKKQWADKSSTFSFQKWEPYIEPVSKPKKPKKGGETGGPKTPEITDTGERIEGARKHAWENTGLTDEQIGGMTEAEKGKHLTKTNIWPRPDYAAVIAEGTHPTAAYMIKTVYDRLPSKPHTDAQRNDYIEMLRKVREIATGIKTMSDAETADYKLNEMLGDKFTHDWEKLKPILHATKSKRYSSGLKYKYVNPLHVGSKDKRKADEAIAKGWPNIEPWSRNFEVEDYGSQWRIKNKNGLPLLTDGTFVRYDSEGVLKREALSQYFDTRDEAVAKARELHEALEKEGGGETKGPKEPKRPILEAIDRKGPDRRKGRKIVAEDFANDKGKSHFDFRGLQWGNYVRETKKTTMRQDLLDVGWDALHDLAEHLGLPPKALSLQGPFRLAVAFGARGHGGKVNATYAPHQAVVNMTLKNGAGSLAHEWSHGFDHFLGEMGQMNPPPYQSASVRTISGWDNVRTVKTSDYEWKKGAKQLPNLPPRLAKAALDVMQALHFQRESPEEAIARQDKEVKKAEDQLNSWKEGAERSRVLLKNGPNKYANSYLKKADQQIPIWEREVSRLKYGDIYRKLVPTDYYQNAKKLSGPSGEYWHRPAELFARAFESWVFDRLAEKGISSPYLVHGVEEGRYAGPEYRGNPYPTGRERRVINDKFDALAQALQADKDGKLTGVAGEAEADQSDWRVKRSYGTQKLSDSFATHLRNEGFKDIVEARSFAKEEGFKDLDHKQIEEELELGVVKRAREIISEASYRDGVKPQDVFGDLMELNSRQPRLSAKTSTSAVLQQYSTPTPLGYIAQYLAGVAPNTRVFEPTAGNGALLTMVRASQATLNELDPSRAQNLRDLGFVPTVHNALGKALYESVTPVDVVLANPPFGPVKDASGNSIVYDMSDIQPGYKTKEADHVIALRALETLKDDGRAVVILGGLNKLQKSLEARSQGYSGKAKREFYKALYDRYNVTDHFTVSGDLYERQGAAWPVDVIVIDGRGKSARKLPAADVPRVIDSWDALKGLLDEPKPVVRSKVEKPYKPGEGPDEGDGGSAVSTGGAGGEPGGTGGPRKPKPVRGGGGGELGPDESGGEVVAGGGQEGGVTGGPGGEPGDTGGPRAPQSVSSDDILDAALTEHGLSEPAAPTTNRTPFGEETAFKTWQESLAYMKERIKYWSGLSENGYFDNLVRQNGRTSLEPATYDRVAQLEQEIKRDNRISHDHLMIANSTADVPGQEHLGRPWSGEIQGYYDHFKSLVDRLERHQTTKTLLDEARRRLKPTAEVAKDAAKGALEGIDDLTKAIGEMFGGSDKGRVNMPVPDFSQETYEQKIKPALIKSAKNFKESKDNIQELVSRLVQYLRDVAGWTKEMFAALRPYLVKFIDDVRRKVIDLFPGTKAGEMPAKKGQATPDMETEHQGVYRPQSDIQGLTTLAPRNLIDAMDHALERVANKVGGDIDQWVADELGYSKDEMPNYLGAEQVDALALAIDALKGNGGFIIGDQTGIGKGRVNAAIIRWAIKNDIVPVFMTAKRGLYADMYRDLSAIGIQDFLGKEPRILETNSSDRFPLDNDEKVVLPASSASEKAGIFNSLEPEKIRDKYDVVFTNYSQLTTVKGEEPARRAFMEKLAPHALFILDESHLAGGEPKARAKKTDPQNLGGYMRDLLGKVQKGAFFSSATYAKRPASMIVYGSKTNMHLAVDKPEELAEAIERGRGPLQEAVAGMLAQDGNYARRERSFKGINFHTDETPVSGGNYPNIASSFQLINDFSKFVARMVRNISSIKEEGIGLVPDFAVGDASLSHTGFTSVMHNIVSNMLLAMKVKRTVEKVKEIHASDQKPLIMLAKTGESFLKGYIEAYNEMAADANPPLPAIEPGSAVPATFNDILHRYLERSRVVLLKPPFQADAKKKPKPVRYRLTDDDLGPRGVELFAKAKDFINSFALADMPIDPISYIKDALTAEGIKIGEITGRGLTLDYSGGGVPILRNRPQSEFNTRGRTAMAKQFNEDNLHGIIFNRAGSTGISLHDSETLNINKPRHTVIIDPEPDINEFMQGLGRANRTGQVSLPTYTIMVTDLPAETRPTSLLMKKLASLNANTTGARGGNIALDVPDFFNVYGDDIAKTFLEDNPDIAAMLDLDQFDAETGRLTASDPIRKMFGRLPLLPPETQASILDHIAEEYKNYIDSLTAAGENGLMAQKLDLRAKALERTEVVGGKSEDSVFGAPVEMIKARVKRLGKPYSSREVVTQIGAGLGYAPTTLFPTPEHTPAEVLRALQDELAGSHNAVTKSALAEHDEYMRKALEDVDAAKVEKEQDRIRATRTRWEAIHDMLPDGRAVRLQTNGGNVTGFVAYSTRPTEPVNPLALGSWKVKILAADANEKSLTIPYSRLYKGRTSMDEVIDEALEADPNSIGVVPINDEHWEDTLARFDSQQSDVFEERYIATGNLLAAYNWLKNKGMIVHYTDNYGVLKQGILTAKNWDLGKHVSERGRIAKTVPELLDHIDASYNSYARNPTFTVDADKVIGIARTYAGYLINTNTAKRTGGYYFTDPTLLKLTGDFIKRGTKMEAVINHSDITKVLDQILKMGAKFKLPPKAMKTEKIPDNGPGEAMFLGDKAKLFDTYAKEQAVKMGKLGLSRDTIWNKTGYVQDPVSKQWYFELDDSKVKFADNVSEKEWARELKRNKENDNHSPAIEVGDKLGNLISHPELFEAVPALRDVHVFIGVGDYYGTSGNISPDGITAHGATWKQMVPVLFHEIQHYVDALQGEHLGTFPEAIIRRNAMAIDEITKEIESGGHGTNSAMMLEGAREAIRRSMSRMSPGFLAAVGPSAGVHKAYEDSQTEIRARETMNRVGMSPAERHRELPEWARNPNAMNPHEPVGLTFPGEDKARMIIEDVLAMHEPHLPPQHLRHRFTGDPAEHILDRLVNYGATHEIETVGKGWLASDQDRLDDALGRGPFFDEQSVGKAKNREYINEFRSRVREAQAYIDIMEALQNAGFEKPVEQAFTIPISELVNRKTPPMLDYQPIIKGSAEWKRWKEEQGKLLREWELRRARLKVEIGKLATWMSDNKNILDPMFKDTKLEGFVDILRNRMDGTEDSLRKELTEYGIPDALVDNAVKVFNETRQPAGLDYNKAQYLDYMDDKGPGEAMAQRRPPGWQPKLSLNGMQIGLPEYVTDAAGIENGRAWVNYQYLASKHPEYFADAVAARAKVEPALANPDFVFPHQSNNYSLVKRMPDGDWLVSLAPSKVKRYNVPTAHKLDPGQLDRMVTAAQARGARIVDLRGQTGEAMASPEVTALFDALETSRNPTLDLPNGGELYVRKEVRPDMGGNVLNLSSIRYSGDDAVGESGGSPNVMQNMRLFSLLGELEQEAARRGYVGIQVSQILNERLIPWFKRRGYENQQNALVDEIMRAQPGIPRAQVEALFSGGSPVLSKKLTPETGEALAPTPRRARPEASQQRAAIENELTGILTRMLGKNIRVEFPDMIPVDENMRAGYGGQDIGERVDSAYFGAAKLIQIISKSLLARQGAYHEAIHAFEDILATDPERQVFKREMPRLRQEYKRIFRQDSTELSDREVRAAVGSIYLLSRERAETGPQVHIGLRAFWEKVKRVVKQLQAWFRERLGMSTFEDVLDRLYTGKAAQRPPRAPRPISEAMASTPEFKAFRAEMLAKYGVELPVGFNRLSETDKLRYELFAAKVRNRDVKPDLGNFYVPKQPLAPLTTDVPSIEPSRIAQDMRLKRIYALQDKLKGTDPYQNAEYRDLAHEIEEVDAHLNDVDKFEKQMADKYGPDWQNKIDDADKNSQMWVNFEAINAIEDAIRERESDGSLEGATSNDPMFRNLDNPVELEKFKREWSDGEAMARRWNDNEIAEAVDWLARSKLGERSNDAVAVRAAKKDLVDYFGYVDPQDYVDLAIRQGMANPRVVQLRKSEPEQLEQITPDEAEAGKPRTIEDAVIEATRGATTEQEVLESDALWGKAERAADITNHPFHQTFAALANSAFQAHGINAYLTDAAAARYIRVSRAKLLSGIGPAQPHWNPMAMPPEEGVRLARMWLERFNGDIQATKQDLEKAIAKADEKGLGQTADLMRKGYEYLTSVWDKKFENIPDDHGGHQLGKVLPFKGKGEAMATPRPPLSGDEQSIQDRLGTGDRRSRVPSWDEIYYKAKDDLDPMSVAEKAMNEGHLLEGFDSPYKLARLTRGNWGRSEQMLQNATYDFNTLENNGPSLKAVLKPVEGQIERFQIYAVAKRAVELADRGIRTGMPIERARRVVAAGRTEFEPHFQNLLGYQDRVLQYLRDSGILSDEGYTRIKDLNQSYVPFYRIMGRDTDLGATLSAGPGLRVRNPVYEIKGSGRRVVQPIESIVRNTFLFVALAERNRALRALKDLSLRSPHGRDWLRRSRMPVRPIDVSPEEINRFLRDEGITEEVGNYLTIFRAQPFRLDNTHIRLFEGGRAQIYEVPELLAKAVNALDRPPLGLLVRILGFPAKLLRAGVILSPEYFPRNVVRDQLSAFINSKNNYRVLYDFGKQLGTTFFARDEKWQDFLKSGAANSTFVALDRNYVHKNIVDYTQLNGWQKLKNVVSKPIDALRFTTELLENSTRVGDMQRGLEAGDDIFEAGYNAREVTLDFARHGGSYLVRIWNYIVPFFNAQGEGIDRTIRQFKASPWATLLRVGLGITLPSLLLWLWNKDDPRWRELPAWQKDFFWIFITDNWVKMGPRLLAEKDDLPQYLKRQTADGTWEYNAGNIWRVPKPFEMGILFGSSVERMMDAFFTDHPDAWRNLRHSIFQGFAPNILPQVLSPMLEHTTNWSLFLDRPLLPDRLNKVEAYYQSQPYSTEIAKNVGAVIDKVSKALYNISGGAIGSKDPSLASPVILENYIRQWTGGLGMHVLNGIDKGMEAIDQLLGTHMTDQIVQPERTWSDIVAIKGFHARFPGSDAESIQRFYDLYNERKKHNDTILELRRRGEPEEVVEKFGERMNVATAASRQMGRAFKTIREIYYDKTITPADKRQLIDKTYMMMIEIAKGGLAVMQDKP